MRRGTRVVAVSALVLPAMCGVTGMAAASTHSIPPQAATHGSPDSNQGRLGGAAITAVNVALSKRGSPYVWGAKGPSRFDCSGLVQYAYRQAGISLPSGTKAQKSAGRAVSESDLQPGDVLYFYSSGSHTGIYVGSGKIVHAPTEGQTVKVESYKSIGSVNTIRRFSEDRATGPTRPQLSSHRAVSSHHRPTARPAPQPTRKAAAHPIRHRH